METDYRCEGIEGVTAPRIKPVRGGGGRGSWEVWRSLMSFYRFSQSALYHKGWGGARWSDGAAKGMRIGV